MPSDADHLDATPAGQLTRPARRRDTLTLLALSALLGVGIKLGSVAVLDEVGLGIFFLLRWTRGRRLALRLRNPYDLCLFYFGWAYLIGFVTSGNVNALRYVAIAALIMWTGDPRLLEPPSRRLIEAASWIFIAITIAIPLVGFTRQLPIAWWQEWLWSGTAYASFGVFVAASILVWRGGLRRFGLVVFLVFASAILNDSRTTFLLSGLLAFPMLRILARPRSTVRRPRPGIVRALSATAAAAAFVVVIGSRYFDHVDIEDFNRTLGALWGSVDAWAAGDPVFDSSRRDMNQTTLDLAGENVLHFVFGAGGLSHQHDMLGLVLTRSGAIVRPTGLPAVIFDGGALLFALMAVSTLIAAWMAFAQRTDLVGGLYLAAIPVVSFALIAVTNLLESTLFWLILKPGFVPMLFADAHPVLKSTGRVERAGS